MRKLGILFMTLGLVLGFFAWQYDGTDTSDSQNEAVKVITQNIEGDTARPAPLPWAQGATIAKPTVKPKKIKIGSKFFDAVGLISIPAAGVENAPVVNNFSQAALDEGLIASRGEPGEIGNWAVIGHVVTHGEVFRDLKKLRKGDLVTIKTVTGTFTYRIRKNEPVTIVDTDVWVLRDVPSKTKNLEAKSAVLTLLTCAERYHTNKRIAIFGDLVKGNPDV